MSGPPPSRRSRNLRNLPTDHANALAREGASRGVSANDVILQVIAAHVQGHGVATDDLIELDVARLYQKLGDGAAVAMVGTAQRLLAWVRDHERLGQWSTEASEWIHREEMDRRRRSAAVVFGHELSDREWLVLQEEATQAGVDVDEILGRRAEENRILRFGGCR